MPASVVRCRYPDGTLQQMRTSTSSGPLAIQAFRLWERVQALKQRAAMPHQGAERREAPNA